MVMGSLQVGGTLFGFSLVKTLSATSIVIVPTCRCRDCDTGPLLIVVPGGGRRSSLHRSPSAFFSVSFSPSRLVFY